MHCLCTIDAETMHRKLGLCICGVLEVNFKNVGYGGGGGGDGSGSDGDTALVKCVACYLLFGWFLYALTLQIT